MSVEQARVGDGLAEDSDGQMQMVEPPQRELPVRRSTSRARSRRGALLPSYPALTVVAWIARMVGGLTILFGLIVLLFGIISAIGIGASGGGGPNSQFGQADAGAAAAATGMISVIAALAPILSGVFIMAAGELLFAVRDIAKNTALALV